MEKENQSSEVGTMLKDLDLMNELVPDDKGEKPGKEEEIEEEVVDESEEEEEVEEEEEEEEEEPEEVDDTPPAPDPLLSDILGKVTALNESLKVKPEDESKEPEPDPDVELDFLEGIDMEALTSKPEVLNKVLNNMVKIASDRGRVAGAKEATEKMLRSIPKLVEENNSQRSAMKIAVQGFYAKNPDLKEWSHAVSMTANEIAAQNPGFTLSQLMDKTGETVRARLKLKGQAKQKKPKFAKTPGGKAGGKKGSSKLKGVAAEIAEMNKLK